MITLTKRIFLLSFLVMTVFPISPTFAVILLEPHGGEILAGGSSFKVQWQESPGEVTYELKYSINGGKQWKTITKGVSGTSYDWTIPLLKANYKDCRIMIIGYNSSRKKVSEDTLDLSFALNVVRVTSPAGEEELTPGNVHTIIWTITPALTSIGQVLLKYSVNNGKKWTAIGTLAGNPGSYDWNVPWLGGSFTECKVMVELKDENGKKVGQYASDGVFSIGFNPDAYSDQIVSEFGEDDGFDALVLAIDKGYSLSQIMDATMTGFLELEGVIVNASGKIKKPENPPTHYFINPDPASDGYYLESTGGDILVKLGDFRKLCKAIGGSIGKGAVPVIIWLTARGYSFEQVLNAILAEEVCVDMVRSCVLWWAQHPQWHSDKECSSGGYRWDVNFTSFDADKCLVRGYINFHNCPGGGKAGYYFEGISIFNYSSLFLCDNNKNPIEPEDEPNRSFLIKGDVLKVEGQKASKAGQLGDDTPFYAEFKLMANQPPDPNYAP